MVWSQALFRRRMAHKQMPAHFEFAELTQGGVLYGKVIGEWCSHIFAGPVVLRLIGQMVVGPEIGQMISPINSKEISF
jgi:hypothetical protein